MKVLAELGGLLPTLPGPGSTSSSQVALCESANPVLISIGRRGIQSSF
jgi:hypothetical protein